MRTIKPTYFLHSAFIISLAITSCDQLAESDAPSDNKISEENSEALGLLPSESFYRQRAYPAGFIDHSAELGANKFRNAALTRASLEKSGANTNPWELAGPLNVGGRVTDVEMRTGTPATLYAGTASGGIFKTDDLGVTWIPLFDDQQNLAIGDMALAPSDNDVIYVGTGEANGNADARNGNGVYRSSNGGSTWNHIGLDSIGGVGRIVVDPRDMNTCFVGAAGYLFQKSTQRGVFKTTDGGLSWQQVLYLNDSTGVTDLAINPQNPDTIYAASWERYRSIDRRVYGGPSSGIFRSYDGGTNWTRLTNGLPSTAGRIGIAISKSDPSILYAVYVDEVTHLLKGMYKSTDHGDSWTTMSTAGINEVNFMWYFAELEIHPLDPDIVYFAGFNVQKSVDGGNSWTTIYLQAHVDQHAICVNPNDPNQVFVGNDGGVNRGTGGSFTFTMSGLPITQFYTCEIDESFPDRLYGGTQDNGTIRTLTGMLDEWFEINGGDGFCVLVDPVSNNYVYAESQFGDLRRSTNGGISFTSALNGVDPTDRNGWNTPVIFHPNDPSVLYYGTNRLYRSTNRAVSWAPISPDLTSNPVQQNVTYGVLSAIAVSAVNDDIIYTGSDDGTVQVSLNSGNSWSVVSSGLPVRWVTGIATDPVDANTAYVSFSGYRYGDPVGHLFKTIDAGMSWVNISGNLPDMPLNDVVIDEANGNLIIATDVGIYFSDDGGSTWNLLGTNLPNVIVMDLRIHDSNHELIAGTYGRGMYRLNLDNNVSVNDQTAQSQIKIRVFPNPNNGQFRIEGNIAHSATYSIHDLQGRVVSSGNVGTGEIDHVNLRSGRYMLQVQDADRTGTVSVIIP